MTSRGLALAIPPMDVSLQWAFPHNTGSSGPALIWSVWRNYGCPTHTHEIRRRHQMLLSPLLSTTVRMVVSARLGKTW